MSPGTLVPLLVFLIPILGIVFAGYKEWLKFKTKQQKLGTSTREVEATIRDLRRRLNDVEEERDALLKRVQNLETIVTSEAWDALQDTSGETASFPDDTHSAPLSAPSTEDKQDSSTQEQAEALARRLRS